MTTTKLTRRAALAGAAALPILPAAAMAQEKVRASDFIATPNATDAAWMELQAAEAAFDAAFQRWEAFEDWITGQIGPKPVLFNRTPWHEFRARAEAWEKARAELPENPHEHPADGGPRERLDAARDALIMAPVTTMTDLERKLSVAYHVDDQPEYAATILAGVRAMIGEGTA